MSQPTVFVRDLSNEEVTKLTRISRTSAQLWRRKRAAILLASHSGKSASHIAAIVRSGDNQVRRVIKEFNLKGLDSLQSRARMGRPPRLGEDALNQIREIASQHPQDLGLALDDWTLVRLRDYVVQHGIIDRISIEHLRRVLRGGGSAPHQEAHSDVSSETVSDVEIVADQHLAGEFCISRSPTCLALASSPVSLPIVVKAGCSSEVQGAATKPIVSKTPLETVNRRNLCGANDRRNLCDARLERSTRRFLAASVEVHSRS